MSEEQIIVRHKPVLVQEVLTYLNPQPGKVYLDATFGSGGHTRAILEKEPQCKVIALDWDTVSLDTFGPPMEEEFGDRLQLVWGNFALLYKLLKKNHIPKLDGILADFGTSQMQIFDRPGFSFNRNTPLDMRMSPSHQRETAADVVQFSSEEMLRELFWQLGEEPNAKIIARAIVHERAKNPIKTTKQLATLIEKVARGKNKSIHPATRVFQALRIYINKELDNISAFLAEAVRTMRDEGRLVCISFHSLEDRMVKQFFKDHEHLGDLSIITKRVVVATQEEIAENPSARSARLRAAQYRENKPRK